jgi:hypothetical protein
MTRQDFTLYSYKTDRRTKTGERLVMTRVMDDMTEDQMAAVVKGLAQPGYRYEYFPAMMTVKNLMTGQDVQIPADTPWCCNPASESYWSM